MTVQITLRPTRISASMLFVLAMTALISGCASQREALGPVVEPDAFARWLADRPTERRVILDARDADAYAAGHVAGAVRVDTVAWRPESLSAETSLEHDAHWYERIGALGISGRDPVVVYDDGRMTEAARVWFVLQHLGVPEVSVLNGGYPALQKLIAEGSIPVSRAPTPPDPTPFDPPRPMLAGVSLVDRHEVRRSVEQSEAQILDARTREEYTGLDLRRNPRGGHIPGAIHLAHGQLLDPDGRLKSPEELAALFEQAGFQRDKPIITHCDGGGRASLAALAAHRAGYGPVMNYYLSFGDWAADAQCPVERHEG